MKFKSILLSVIAAAACTVRAGEVIDLTNPDVWAHKYMFDKSAEPGTLRVSRMFCLSLKNRLKIDASKKYILKGKVRTTEDSPDTILVAGFIFHGKQGQRLPIAAFNAYKDSYAVLAEPVKKGDTKLKVKAENPKVWRAVPGFVVAFQAQKDLSDLPNENISPNLDKVVKNADGTQTVTLKGACKADYPAGTSVRLSGGYSIYFNWKRLPKVTKEWQEFSAEITGEQLPAGQYDGKKFPAGADTLEFFVMVNWLTKPASTSELKDFTLEVL